MNKKKIILCIIIVLVIVFVGIIINKTNKKDNNENEKIENEEGFTGLIDNEEYYYNKQKEYDKAFEEYEELVVQYKNEKFTEEQKSVIQEYNKRMTEAQDKETKQQLSDKYVEIYNEYLQQQLSKEELNILDEKRKQMDKLEPIVNEYQELIIKAEEEKRKEGLETFENGNIKNNRKGIIEEKEYQGLKFSNIELIYNPTKKQTTISMKIENITDETQGNKLIALNFTGDTECKYPIKLEEISAREYIEINIPVEENLIETDNLTITNIN